VTTAAQTVPTQAAPAEPTVAPTAEPAAQQAAAPADAPAWFALPLTDVRTGETFTFADFSGKTVLVRAMAEWCTNCRNGQRAWRDQVLPQVDGDNVVFVSLDVETNNSAESLAGYAEGNEFPWRFAVMTPEIQAALAAHFGNAVNIPPAEPQWLIRPDGSVVGLITDHSPQTLLNLIGGAA
jgi:cytochrome oxidase Cu insertion factor (SCO1/SenC/PrrC family)